jgi:outer membrane protein OmpA-like peptidoglycan-associated protein
MTDEDLLYKAMLREDSVKNNELYTIIKDIVRLTKIEKPDNIIAFETIYFDFDKFFLRFESKEILEKILAFMISNPQLSIEIKGHTDWMGTDSYNIKLSQRRSESAFNYLVSGGVSKERLTMKWFGESKSAVSNTNPDGSDNEENRQLNRRCEFTLTAANGLAYVIVLE